jgi:hypothetical protein
LRRRHIHLSRGHDPTNTTGRRKDEVIRRSPGCDAIAIAITSRPRRGRPPDRAVSNRRCQRWNVGRYDDARCSAAMHPKTSIAERRYRNAVAESRSPSLCIPPALKHKRRAQEQRQCQELCNWTRRRISGRFVIRRTDDQSADTLVAGWFASSLQTCYREVMHNFTTFVPADSPRTSCRLSPPGLAPVRRRRRPAFLHEAESISRHGSRFESPVTPAR